MLDKLDAERLEETTNVGYRSRMVVKTPDDKLLFREDRRNQRVELRFVDPFSLVNNTF